MKRNLRIGFVSATAPDDVHAQSGIPWFMRSALERYSGAVDHLGPVRPWIARPLRFASRVSRRFPRHRFVDTNSERLSRAYGRILSSRVASTGVDWLFAPYASAEIAHLETAKPILYYSDTTFRAVCDYYPSFSGLSARARRAGDEVERRAIERATIACFASDWAAASAIRDYGAPPDKVVVLPMSANLLDPPPLDSLRFDRHDDVVRLLFVGVDWERKGGPIACDALATLRRMGVKATLTVVGCLPPAEFRTAGVSVAGFLSKRDASQRATLESLFRNADFLIVPTRAECYGCVFVEAASFALPSVAPKTGGVASALADGVSGLLLPAGSVGEDYASAIADVVSDATRFRALRVAARRAFDARLSWEVWSRRINQLTARFRVEPRHTAEPVRTRATA
ncbi:MAG TPA: glycosyltransferase family 4 protein [Gemmatimonadaceae bacterium]|nr:glycosyltransferase family 4 protein [Gemmatimonadaceae bacterium]